VPSQPRAPCRPRQCLAPVEVEAAGINPRNADNTPKWCAEPEQSGDLDLGFVLRSSVMLLCINPQPVSLLPWKVASIFGASLIAVGVTAGYVDVATHFEFPFLSNDFEAFIVAMLVGVFLVFVGVIGWAKHLKPRARARFAGIVFAAPWIALLVGYPIAGNNIHGPGAILLVMIVPATILALVLLIMAGF